MQTRRSVPSSTTQGLFNKPASVRGGDVEGFRYNREVAVVLVPCIVVLAAHGGHFSVATAVIGLMIAYLFDSVRQPEACFVTFWVTLITITITVLVAGVRLLRHSLFALFLVYNMACLIVLLGIWGSLNTSWIRNQTDVLCRAGERILLACITGPSAVLLTWGIVALVGIDNAPFYYQWILILHHFLLALPRPSSYAQRSSHSTLPHDGPGRLEVLGPFESGILVAAMFIIPPAFYVALYHPTIFHLNHLVNVAALVLSPFVYLWAAARWRPLGFTTWDDDAQDFLVSFFGSLALAGLVACFEARVVFGAFVQYLVFPPPYSYMVVTAALYSAYALVLIHVHGWGTVLSKDLALYLSMFAALSWALLVGLPLPMVSFPMVGVYFGFIFVQTRSTGMYAIFAISVAAVAVWFMIHTFGFLQFQFVVGRVRLLPFVGLLAVLLALALAAPGLTLADRSPVLLKDKVEASPRSKWVNLTGTILVTQAFMFMVAEKLIFEQGDMYPATLLLFTSALGVLLTHTLASRGRVTETHAWLMMACYSSKASALLHAPSLGLHTTPQESVWISVHAFLALAAVYPVCLHLPGLARHDMAPEPTPMSPVRGAAHALSMAIVSFMSRKTLFARLLFVLSQTEATEVSLHAFALGVFAIGCLPLSCAHFKASPALCRLNLFCLGTAGVLGLVQPPISRAALSDLFGMRHQGPYRLTAHMLGTQPSVVWPPWLLTGALLLLLASVAGIIPVARSQGIRIVVALLAGPCLGLAGAGYFIPSSPLIFFLFSVASSLGCAFVLLAFFPTVYSHRFLPWLFALWVACLPLIYASAAVAYQRPRVLSGASDYVATTRMLTLSTYAAACIALALLLRYRIASPRRAVGRTTRAVPVQEERTWMVRVCNGAAILGYALCVVVQLAYFEGSELCVFFLAPILLLHLPGEGSQRGNRYFPLTSAMSVLLAVCVACKLILAPYLAPLHLLQAAKVASWSWQVTAQHAAMLLAVAPTHTYFNIFLWKQQRQSELWVALLMPLCAIPILLAEIPAMRLLGAYGIVGGLVHLYSMHRVKKEGLRLI